MRSLTERELPRVMANKKATIAQINRARLRRLERESGVRGRIRQGLRDATASFRVGSAKSLMGIPDPGGLRLKATRKAQFEREKKSARKRVSKHVRKVAKRGNSITGRLGRQLSALKKRVGKRVRKR